MTQSDLKTDLSNDHAKTGDFSNFNISEGTLKKLKDRGVNYLFPIQSQTFEAINSGLDILAQAKTGTGKTFAFAIPIVEKLQSSKKFKKCKQGRSPSTIILAPTRELVQQIKDDIKAICLPNLKVLSIYGGVPYEKQEVALEEGVDIVVGTTGRVKDLIEKTILKLKNIKFVVLDEVDMMLDMGFRDDVELILGELYGRFVNKTDELIKKNSVDWGDLKEENNNNKETHESKRPQTLFFSATVSGWVRDISKKYLRYDSNEVHSINLVPEDSNLTSDCLEHLAILCPRNERAKAISDVLRVYCSDLNSRAMVFCERKVDADELSTHSAMTDCHVYHGDIPQEKRSMIIEKFRSGKYRTIITTNVGSRGLDIPSVDLVIQCRPPKDTDDYIHRSGRAGRAGRLGKSVIFFTTNERENLALLEQKAGIKFRRVNCPTAEEIAHSSRHNTLNNFNKIPESAWTFYKDIAGELISEIGAERALCCALACINGKTEGEIRKSTLTTRPGYTGYLLTSTKPIFKKTYAYVTLNKLLDPDLTEKLSHLMFIKDKKGFVFDFPSEYDEEIKNCWQDSETDKLELLVTIPELEPYPEGGFHNGPANRSSDFNNQNGFSNNRGRGRGRGRGNFQSGNGRGNFNNGPSRGRGNFSNGSKRKFDNNSESFENNFNAKKTKKEF